jgi:hypothetical protein
VELATGAAMTTAAPLRLSPVEVDLGGLDDFRTFVSRELDANLRPSTDTIAVDHRRGVGFGDRNVGASVQTARRRYYETLATSTANMAGYIQTAEILIDAIRQIARDYRETDLTSAAGSAAVNRQLTAAMVAAARARADALDSAQRRAWRLRTDRLAHDIGPGE